MESIQEIAKNFFGKGIEKFTSTDGKKPGGKEGEDDSYFSKEDAATLKSLLEMFQYASPHDMMLLFIGTLFTVINGASYAVLAVMFGNIAETFIIQSHGGFANSTHRHHRHHHAHTHAHNKTSRFARSFTNLTSGVSGAAPATNATSNDNPLAMIADIFGYVGKTLGLSSESQALTKDEFVSYADTFALYFLCIAAVVFVASFIQTVCWELAAENQTFRIRQNLLNQVMRQEIGWFEINTPGYVISKLADDVERIREGIGHKFSVVVQYCSCFAIGAFFGLCINWKLTFIFGLSVPFIISKILFLVKLFAAKAVRRQDQYGKVGSISEDVLEDVRSVTAYGTVSQEFERYKGKLMESYERGMKDYYVIGFGTGALYLIIYAAFAAATLYASSQLYHHLLTTKIIYTVFTCVSMAIIALSNILPFITNIAYSQGCLQAVAQVIESYPNIDPYSGDGRRPHKFGGKIKLTDVTFSYPTRQDVSVLRDFNLTIQPGSTVAIVAPSGEGKSTLVDLLLRFFDPQAGVITYDDFDLKSLNLKWLRDHVGIVTSDSSFQADTIYNNITGGNEDVTMEEVLRASKTACAHHFIMEMEYGYGTMIGISDRELSAGQKQLLAIARVLVRKPTILILDEAYSAQSLEEADELLRNLRKTPLTGTTVILSHRATRIDSIPIIHVLHDGKIVETGSHSELMAMKGVYFKMAEIEGLSDKPSDNCDDDDLVPEIPDEKIIIKKKEEEDADNDGVPDDEDEDNLKYPSVTEFREQIFRNPEATKFMTLGVLGCIISGLVPPFFALTFSQLFISFSEKGDDLSSHSAFWAKIVFVIGVAAGAGYWLRTVYVSAIGESLSCFLRNDMYSAIMKQTIPWFDEEDHTSERLYNLLSRNAPIFKVSIGSRFGTVVSSIVSLITTIIMAFVFAWQLAFVIITAIPVQCLVIHYNRKSYQKTQITMDNLMEEALATATEAVQDFKTVQTLSLQAETMEEFETTGLKIFSTAQTQSLNLGLPFAISETIPFIVFAAVFSTGAHLIDAEYIEPMNLFKLFIVLVFSSFTIPQVGSFVPDYVMGKLAYANLYTLVEEAEADDVHSPDLNQTPEIKGGLLFDNVSFSYAGRPEDPVLREICFGLKAGAYLGVIGGDGKSTLLSLILRLYECTSGTITIDGVDIKKINLDHIRKSIGYVAQDPTLFNRSIRENILYGYTGGKTGDELQKLIEEVAKAVYMDKFIESLPDGYDTDVGAHGSSLTAGERQRIAIARAFIRDPKIFVFDEPTSALGPEQEMMLLESIKKHAVGKTVIIASKQPKIIAMAELIAVLGDTNGEIIECGTHEELAAQGGVYSEFMKQV